MKPRHTRFGMFILLTYLFAWMLWVPMALTHTYVYPGQGWPTHLIGLMAPSLSAAIVTWRYQGKAGLQDLGQRLIRLRFNRVSVFLILGTLLFAIAPVLIDPTISISDLGEYSGAAPSVLGVLFVLLINGFGEEIGWRGYLADELLKTESIAKSATKVWAVWAPWHFPLFFVVDTYRHMGVAGAIGWIVGIYFGSVVLTWFYAYSKGSLPVVVAWHIAYNFCVATAASTDFTTGLVSTLVVIGAIAILRTDQSRTTNVTNAD